MRRLLLVLLVVLVVGVAADFAAARLAEDKVAQALQREYRLDRRPVVSVRDFPFLPHLLAGRLDAVDLAATQVRAEGVTLAQVELHLHGVHVDRSMLLGAPGRVTVDQADGTAELGQAELSRLLAERLQGGSVEIGAQGVRLRATTTLLGQPLSAEVTGRLAVSGGRVRFTPERVQAPGVPPALTRRLAPAFAFELPLPPLPAGIQVERVSTRPGVLLVAGRASRVQVAT